MKIRLFVSFIVAVVVIAAAAFINNSSRAAAGFEIDLVPTAQALATQPNPKGKLEAKRFKLEIKVTGFVPGTELLVFLTQQTTANRVQAQFVGTLVVGNLGSGKFELEGLDLNRAFALYAPNGTPPNIVPGGVAGVDGAVTCQAGPTTAGVDTCEVVRLNAVRLYFAETTAGITRAFDLDGVSGPVPFVGVTFPDNLQP